MQQFQVAYDDGAGANPVDLAAELGLEAAAIDRLGAALGTTAGRRCARSASGNAQRFGEVSAGGRRPRRTRAPTRRTTPLTPDLLADIDSRPDRGGREGTTPRDRERRGHRRSPPGRRPPRPPGREHADPSRSAACARRPRRWPTVELPDDRRPDPRGRASPARSRRSTSRPTRRSGSSPGPSTRCTARRSPWPPARPSCAPRSATMFVTLSRRNTSLINQQLGLIESLEQDEEDPQPPRQPLPSRPPRARGCVVRRTRLMVLADAPNPPGRRHGLTVSDVLQAAIAGVQDYQRVQFVSTPSSAHRRRGRAPTSSTCSPSWSTTRSAYSPPTEHGAGADDGLRRGGVLVEIADAGLGIPDDELDAAQRPARSPAARSPPTPPAGWACSSSAGSRADTASRVQLEPNADGGTTARVVLPAQLLQRSARSRRPRRGAGGDTRAAAARGAAGAPIDRAAVGSPDPVALVGPVASSRRGAGARCPLPDAPPSAAVLGRASGSPSERPTPEPAGPVPEPVAVTRRPEPQRPDPSEPVAAPAPARPREPRRASTACLDARRPGAAADRRRAPDLPDAAVQLVQRRDHRAAVVHVGDRGRLARPPTGSPRCRSPSSPPAGSADPAPRQPPRPRRRDARRHRRRP